MPNKQDQEVHEEARPIKQEPLDLNEVLKSLDPQKREIITKAIYAIEEQKSFSGPLPAPEDFMAYKNVMPDAPERILAMAERQSSSCTKTPATTTILKKNRFPENSVVNISVRKFCHYSNHICLPNTFAHD
jgi:hypothetical protein